MLGGTDYLGSVGLMFQGFIYYKYFMDIASEISKAFEALLSNQQFTSHILEYTLSALETIYNLPQSQQLQTPPPFIILLSHIISTNQSLTPFISTLPKETQSSMLKLMAKYASQAVHIDNTYFHNLCDVQWQMFIQNGRQIWQVKLFTFQNKNKPFTLKLNYEQLSILTFQVSQIVNQIHQIQNR